MFLHRQIDGVAPTFAKKPAIRQEDDGKRLLFECKIKADPKPSVVWSHNAVEVKESKRHKVNSPLIVRILHAWLKNTMEIMPNVCINIIMILILLCAYLKSLHKQQTIDKQEGQSYFASLEINNVTVEDAGKYKVTAKNELGESNATISLNFDSEYTFSYFLLVSYLLFRH